MPGRYQLPQRLRDSDHVSLAEAQAGVTHDIGEAAPLPRQQCRVGRAVPVLRPGVGSRRPERIRGGSSHGGPPAQPLSPACNLPRTLSR
jgi:hypothetical protein